MIERTLQKGDRGPDVREWQIIVGIEQGTDYFGTYTEKKTMQWQMARGLSPNGIVGPETLAALGAIPIPRPTTIPGEPGARWPLVQAVVHRVRPAGERQVRLIVMHTMEASEKPGTAEAVAAWFGGLRGPAPRASAHACVDNDSVVRCVLAAHDAAAAPGANADGYHIELAGRSAQGAAGWADDYSLSMLAFASDLAAEAAVMFAVPIRRLTTEEVRGKVLSGFCGHHEVSLAFRKSTHVDPGPTFPWEAFLTATASWAEKYATA